MDREGMLTRLRRVWVGLSPPSLHERLVECLFAKLCSSHLRDDMG